MIPHKELDDALCKHCREERCNLMCEGTYTAKKGKGVRRKVSGDTKLPDNWLNFLRDSMNEKYLRVFDSHFIRELNN